jgi:hypothetical protein
MANTFTKIVPSGSTTGMGIKVVAVATLGTLFHQAGAGTTNFDEIWLWLFNSDTASHVVTIEFGDATAPDHNIVIVVPPKAGLICAIPGLVLQNSLSVTVFADAANLVTMSGYVNRITVA